LALILICPRQRQQTPEKRLLLLNESASDRNVLLVLATADTTHRSGQNGKDETIGRKIGAS
jgi:hypothetical protein